jgi:small subunit ribosomal protein S20
VLGSAYGEVDLRRRARSVLAWRSDAFGVTTSPRTKVDSSAVTLALGFVSHAVSIGSAAVATIGTPARCGPFHAMPNIKQQEKRVRIAERQRAENIRYRSTVKTLTKRLQAAVEAGDAEAIATEHRTLVRWVDRAASKGALHANTAARKKAQAARLVAGSAS